MTHAQRRSKATVARWLKTLTEPLISLADRTAAEDAFRATLTQDPVTGASIIGGLLFDLLAETPATDRVREVGFTHALYRIAGTPAAIAFSNAELDADSDGELDADDGGAEDCRPPGAKKFTGQIPVGFLADIQADPDDDGVDGFAALEIFVEDLPDPAIAAIIAAVAQPGRLALQLTDPRHVPPLIDSMNRPLSDFDLGCGWQSSAVLLLTSGSAVWDRGTGYRDRVLDRFVEAADSAVRWALWNRRRHLPDWTQDPLPERSAAAWELIAHQQGPEAVFERHWGSGQGR
ncbi:MAG: hypothetical protein WKF57_06495 [Nakamurella sp.]